LLCKMNSCLLNGFSGKVLNGSVFDDLSAPIMSLKLVFYSVILFQIQRSQTFAIPSIPMALPGYRITFARSGGSKQDYSMVVSFYPVNPHKIDSGGGMVGNLFFIVVELALGNISTCYGPIIFNSKDQPGSVFPRKIGFVAKRREISPQFIFIELPRRLFKFHHFTFCGEI